MDLPEVTAELLALPLDQFTSARNARAKELKRSGKAELAAQVSALKKPPVQLWAANQVARADPAVLRKVRDAAEAVARAQTGAGTGARDLRAASDAFQAALDRVTTAAESRLRQGKHSASEDTLRRVRDMFRLAALQDGDVWQQVQRGALITEPSPADDVLTMFQAGVPGPQPSPQGGGRSRGGRRSDEDPHAARAAERAARLDAERAEQLEDVARRLRAEAEEAAAQAKRADDRAKEAEKQAADARRQAARSARATR